MNVHECVNQLLADGWFVLFAELCRINEHQKVALDLDPYVKKLLNARRRVVLVNNILQNAQVSGSLQHLEHLHQLLLLVYQSPGGPGPVPHANILSPGAPEAAQPQRGQGDGAKEDYAGGFGGVSVPLSQ